ncbi:MAG TPA: hypothetical protein VFD30_18580 [Terriglobia bacterium]|nr:hypothetical protein [Terriglobia bacterium]
MSRRVTGALLLAFVTGVGTSRADFKYTSTGKITGGMMAGMMKVMGAFSKQAREPVVTTHYLKGNRMRIDHSDGNSQIIDLEGRRIIAIDNPKKTYSVVTFEQMKAALERARQQATGKGTEVKMTPKFEVTPTGNSRDLLGHTAKEVKVKLEMLMQSEDAKQQSQSMAMIVNSDMWLAPSVPGYEEVQQFQTRMAKELDWLPGAVFRGDPKMSEAMLEMRKHAAEMKGMPLLQVASIGMGGMPAAQQNPAEAKPAETQTSAPQTQKPSAIPSEVLAKGLGGVFGGFGRKKKQQPPQEADQGTATEPAPSGSTGGSLMDMTTEVTSISNDPLSASLFEPPAGYAEVQGDAERVLGGRR